ncbi:iron-sulfur cluster assembly scaffold protein [Vineibacter terrae]|uniref:Iron-sulfur cluster assembly scaffold protein n=1 Tax=Vineibacter terrae TaxID=2586908 RepID=A0A5C8PH54_9HYPH|nr:iron-sulfur cluster assembly scaffold protein [Vineibacter terrae]TXL72970.1 iron-sulfur cluster assembly scaffold protein [Vineibacter terrae]HEX2890612.1 iron-sulfur cluster assembly scaffold protein [Vineibacter terrae]
MSDALYHDRIVALAKSRAGAGKLEAPTASARRDNPLCGDRVTMDVRLDDQDRIVELAHQVRGCALCQASAVALAARATGLPKAEIGTLRAEIDAVLDGTAAGEGDFAAFAPVRPYRSRHDCVTLPFEALQDALKPR